MEILYHKELVMYICRKSLFNKCYFESSSLSLASDTIAGNVNITCTLTADSISGDVTSQLPSGSVSSSIQIDVTQTTNWRSINQYTDSLVKTKLNAEQVLSGSLVPQLPTGVVSGSSQVDAASVANFDSEVDARINAKFVISGSDQIVDALNESPGIVSSSVQIKNVLNEEEVLSGSTHAGNQTFSNNVTISGNLDVAGTTTYTSTNNVNIGDNILELNFGGSATTVVFSKRCK